MPQPLCNASSVKRVPAWQCSDINCIGSIRANDTITRHRNFSQKMSLLLSDDEFEQFIRDPRLGKQRRVWSPYHEQEKEKVTYANNVRYGKSNECIECTTSGGAEKHTFPILYGQQKFTRVTVKRVRCGSCDGCIQSDCGRCANCADKPRFGGLGVRKQSCILKRCLKPIIERSLA